MCDFVRYRRICVWIVFGFVCSDFCISSSCSGTERRTIALPNLIRNLLYEAQKEDIRATDLKKVFGLLARIEVIEEDKHREDIGSDHVDKRLELFQNWAQHKMQLHEGVTLYNFPNEGFGLIAQQNLTVNSTLVTFAPEIAISGNQPQFKEIGNPALRLRNPKIAKFLPIALRLLLEREKDENSGWKPFVDILPSHMAHVAYFDVHGFHLMESSSIFNESASFFMDLVSMYASTWKTVQEKSSKPQILRFSWNRFRWAFANAVTRSMEQGPKVAMIPYWDIVNRREDGQLNFKFQENKYIAQLTEPVKAGAQIFQAFTIGHLPSFEPFNVWGIVSVNDVKVALVDLTPQQQKIMTGTDLKNGYFTISTPFDAATILDLFKICFGDNDAEVKEENIVLLWRFLQNQVIRFISRNYQDEQVYQEKLRDSIRNGDDKRALILYQLVQELRVLKDFEAYCGEVLS